MERWTRHPEKVAWGGTATIDLVPDPNCFALSITDNGVPKAVADPYIINNVKEPHDVVVTYAIPPTLYSVTPGAAKINALVTLAGSDFGAVRGTSKVRFGDVVATYYESCPIPRSCARCRRGPPGP